jgi:hypothetical protein
VPPFNEKRVLEYQIIGSNKVYRNDNARSSGLIAEMSLSQPEEAECPLVGVAD